MSPARGASGPGTGRPGGARRTSSSPRAGSPSVERYIMAEHGRVPSVIKHGELFLVSDTSGDLSAAQGSHHGLYAWDTRFLNKLQLTMNGRVPVRLSWTDERGYAAGMEYTNLELRTPGNPPIPQASVHLRRSRFIADRLYDRLRIRNYGEEAIDLTFRIEFGTDFADMLEVRGARRHERRTITPRVEDGTLVFELQGTGDGYRRTVVAFDPQPDELADGAAVFRLHLEPRERSILRFTVKVETERAGPAPAEEFNLQLGGVRREHERLRAEGTQVFSDSELFSNLLRRSQTDLGMLLTDTRWGRVPLAGLPWFAALFGRDLALTGLQTLMLDPRIARSAIGALARLQGAAEDAETLEQPGKILHELRRGELARLKLTPHRPSFFSVDTTPLFLVLIARTVSWLGDLEYFELLRENVLDALRWIDQYGDLDGDGFVEYRQDTGAGTLQQGWRNSRRAMTHPDGRPIEGPIALAEVQGYVYQAKWELAELFGQLGDIDRAERLQAQARELKRRFNEAFWMDDEEYLAMALDGDKRQVHNVVSLAGHALFSRIISDDHAPAVVRRLLSPDMLSGWGVRMLSRTSPLYNPASFYDGGIWPADNALLVHGLTRTGFLQEAARITTAVVETSRYFLDRRLPELFCGFTRREAARPVAFPMACSPHATSAGAVYLMLQSMLGLYPASEENTLYIQSPSLPRWLGEVTVSNLQIARSTVSLRFRRKGNQTVLTVRDKRGPVRIVIVE